MFSISSFEIPQVPSMGNWQRKEKEKERVRGGGGGEEQGGRGGCIGEDRKALDAEDGKFGERGPIFNSGCQATDEQQGRKGWRARGRPHWVTVPHVDGPKGARPRPEHPTHLGWSRGGGFMKYLAWIGGKTPHHCAARGPAELLHSSSGQRN